MLMIQSNEKIEMGKLQVAQGNTQVKVQEMRMKQQMFMLEAQSKAALEERDFRFQAMEAQYQKKIDQIEAELKSTALDDKEEIEKLKIELGATKTQLEDAQHDEQIELDRYKADLSASTSILVEQMKQVSSSFSTQKEEEEVLGGEAAFVRIQQQLQQRWQRQQIRNQSSSQPCCHVGLGFHDEEISEEPTQDFHVRHY